MRHVALSTLLFASCPILSAQDLIHYKFDSGCTNEVINYAVGSTLGNGTIETSGVPAGFVSLDPAGKFGGALVGGSAGAAVFYNRVKTGWVNPNVTGDFTMAFFMRERVAPGTSLSYMWSTAGALRMFTGGIANTGLYQRSIVASGGAGSGMDLQLTTDVQTLAAAGWVHIALVIDAAAATAVWYIDGVADTTTTGVGGALINQTGEVHLGNHSGTSGWIYDLDEVVFSTRAYSPAEVLSLANAPRAGAGAYTSEVPSQCGSIDLGTAGGAPTTGNAAFQLSINSSVVGLYSLLLGSSRCQFGGGAFVLPISGAAFSPLAASCTVLAAGDFGGTGGTLTGAPGSIAVPIPNSPGLVGLVAYAQLAVLNLGGAGAVVEASNGVSIGIGL